VNGTNDLWKGWDKEEDTAQGDQGLTHQHYPKFSASLSDCSYCGKLRRSEGPIKMRLMPIMKNAITIAKRLSILILSRT